MGDLPLNFTIPVFPGGMTRPFGYSAAIPVPPAPFCVRPAEIRAPFGTPDGNGFVSEYQVQMGPQPPVLNGMYRAAAPANPWPVMMSPLNFVANVPYNVPPVPFYGQLHSDGNIMYPMQSNIVGYVVSQQQFGIPQLSYVPVGSSYHIPMQPVYYEPRPLGGEGSIPDERHYDEQQDEHPSDLPASERSYGSGHTDTHGPTASEENLDENTAPAAANDDCENIDQGNNNGTTLGEKEGSDEGGKKKNSTAEKADAKHEDVIATASNSNNNFGRSDNAGRSDVKYTGCQCSSGSTTKEEQPKNKTGPGNGGQRPTSRQNQQKQYPSKRGEGKKP